MYEPMAEQLNLSVYLLPIQQHNSLFLPRTYEQHTHEMNSFRSARSSTFIIPRIIMNINKVTDLFHAVTFHYLLFFSRYNVIYFSPIKFTFLNGFSAIFRNDITRPFTMWKVIIVPLPLWTVLT